MDSNLYGVFSSQVVVFDLLRVLCSEVCPGKASMVSRRQSCRGKSQSPVVRIAEEMETEPSKPIDKIEQRNPRGRASPPLPEGARLASRAPACKMVRGETARSGVDSRGVHSPALLQRFLTRLSVGFRDRGWTSPPHRHRLVRDLSFGVCDLNLHRRLHSGEPGIRRIHARLHRKDISMEYDHAA